jgi:hypothetical protein
MKIKYQWKILSVDGLLRDATYPVDGQTYDDSFNGYHEDGYDTEREAEIALQTIVEGLEKWELPDQLILIKVYLPRYK